MQKIGHWLRYWLRYAKKTPERQTRPLIGGCAMAFWLLRRGWEIGVAEQKINQSSSAERAQALPACRYLMQWRYSPLREILQREAGEVKRAIFYETKPTSLLEST